jgi:catechol 2,3-dioxygenase-like lactoylglutathione lyase family enzyme
MTRAIHHFDLWVQDPTTAVPEWSWLLAACGWNEDFVEETSGAWKHPDGTYTFLERSPDLLDERHDRLRPGINHLAFTVPDVATLDAVRADAAAHGWSELYADKYPHAGGDDHTAVYLENSESFEVEVVVEA